MTKSEALARQWRELADRLEDWANYPQSGSVEGLEQMLRARRVIDDLLQTANSLGRRER